MPINGDSYTFSDENLNNAPETGGVYVLYSSGSLIYIGRSRGGTTTIRSRLKDHKSGREGPCTQSADTYKRESCNNPNAREVELLNEYKWANGKLPRCNAIMP